MFAPPQAAHSARSRPRRMFPRPKNAPRRGLFGARPDFHGGLFRHASRPSPRSFSARISPFGAAFRGARTDFQVGLFRPAPPLDAALFGEFLYFCGGLFLSAAARLSRRATVPLCKQKIRARSTIAPRRPARKNFLRPESPEAPTPRPRCGCVFLQTEKQRLRMPMQRRCFDRGADGLVPAVADKSETTRKERLFRIPPFTIRFGFSSCTSGKSRRRSEGRRLSFFGFQCFSDIPKSFSRLNRNLRFLTFCDIPSVKLSVHEKFSFFLPNCDTILF